MEKFFRSNEAVVATVYCPIVFPPAPVIAWKESGSGGKAFDSFCKFINYND